MTTLEDIEGEINVDSFDKKYRIPFDRSLVDKLPDDQITWNQHIRGLFTLNQAKCMKSASSSVILTDYTTMQDNPKVNDRITNKKMPKYNPWPDYQIALFNRWIRGGYQKGDPVNSDPNDKVNKIMDLPLPFEVYTSPEAFETNSVKATYHDHIVHIFADSDQRAWEADFDGETIDSYESFRAAAEEYNSKEFKNKPEEVKNNNLIYAILDSKTKPFPKDQPWQPSWKNVLKNWIKNGYERGYSATDVGV
jgi:hypothetical protein